ncbi:hypothetical protein [Burkholderia cepacia]|uniref:hypothetical protein n=1 Tax=Burkholderia cepacia TaxID=292 RepID=UPI00264CA711|nr:hypothetical protein [Burkholderia cepacia]MDN7913711.1 hypothetical protein [Burkholderia cepacia]
MKTTILAAAIFASALPISAFAGPREDCNLLSGTVAMAATWRDNGVPLSKAQANVDNVLNEMPASSSDHASWRRAVATIYSSNVTSEQVQERLQANCR